MTRAETILAGMDAGVLASDQITARASRVVYAGFRRARGYGGAAPLLTPPGAQPKLGKSLVPTYGLTLVPERTPGLVAGAPVNMCPAASAGCAAACLNTAGKGGMSAVQAARETRAAFLLAHPYDAGVLLAREISAASSAHGVIRIRLNVVSDIRWERVVPSLFEMFADVEFYDYTAWSADKRDGRAGNYSLTYSRKETSADADMSWLLHQGQTVAVVFDVRRGRALPESWLGFPVVDGDLSDDRTLDPAGVVVGLRTKGRIAARESGAASGFAVLA